MPCRRRRVLTTNDIYFGYSASQVWSFVQKLGNDARSAGCIPIIATIPSGDGSETARQAYDALVRANWKTAGFAALDDVAAYPALGASNAHTNTACFNGDGIHLTGPGAGSCYASLSGYGLLARNLGNVINMLDGSTEWNPTVTTSNAYTESYADNYALQTPTASATNTLPDCTGLTSMKRTIINGSSSNAITVNTSASQTITGSATVAANATAVFTCELTAASTGGNYWLRTQ
jgi:hypothetical protein